MRDENYYREKQNRIDQKLVPSIFSIVKSFRIKRKALDIISGFFASSGDYTSKVRKVTVYHNHTRTAKERAIRRYKHACRIANAHR